MRRGDGPTDGRTDGRTGGEGSPTAMSHRLPLPRGGVSPPRASCVDSPTSVKRSSLAFCLIFPCLSPLPSAVFLSALLLKRTGEEWRGRSGSRQPRPGEPCGPAGGDGSQLDICNIDLNHRL